MPGRLDCDGLSSSSPLAGESLPSGSDPRVSAKPTEGGGAEGTAGVLSGTTPIPDPSPQGGRERAQAAVPALFAVATLLLAAGPATAQAPACTLTPVPGPPPREVLRCADGLTVEAEAGSATRLRDRNGDRRIDAIDLTGKALLIEAPARPGQRFQILTPHAIASVRGTTYAVDVSAERTSVFVVRGAVAVAAVRRPGRPVILRAGEGVDVEGPSAPLEVKRWGAPRVAALLARFGR
jgi:ferric-dicitrate binding protein FerR (iron transport regulator)